MTKPLSKQRKSARNPTWTTPQVVAAFVAWGTATGHLISQADCDAFEGLLYVARALPRKASR